MLSSFILNGLLWPPLTEISYLFPKLTQASDSLWNFPILFYNFLIVPTPPTPHTFLIFCLLPSPSLHIPCFKIYLVFPCRCNAQLNIYWIAVAELFICWAPWTTELYCGSSAHVCIFITTPLTLVETVTGISFYHPKLASLGLTPTWVFSVTGYSLLFEASY